MAGKRHLESSWRQRNTSSLRFTTANSPYNPNSHMDLVQEDNVIPRHARAMLSLLQVKSTVRAVGIEVNEMMDKHLIRALLLRMMLGCREQWLTAAVDLVLQLWPLPLQPAAAG